ncbi:MAG: hypothetical protein K2Y23_06345, partial [Cyanobacteria bacterium]|nr:hypothetical protein [Cyanobacteriota bacterium]
FYSRVNRHSDAFKRVTVETPEFEQLAADAAAVFQTAYETYRQRRYTLPEGGGRLHRHASHPGADIPAAK